jgi:hypothetical protein
VKLEPKVQAKGNPKAGTPSIAVRKLYRYIVIKVINFIAEKLIGKAIANALPHLNDDVEEAKETTMVGGVERAQEFKIWVSLRIWKM